MARPYAKLRGLLLEYDITQEHLARVLLLSKTSVSKRMMGHWPWQLDECYKILDMVHQPPEELHAVFPRDGINEPDVKRRKVS